MSEKYKHLEGTVSVNGDKTPITRKPIDQIDSSKWGEMTFEQLINQFGMLQSRINVAKSMGRADLTKQMENGLKLLHQMIQEKEPSEQARLI